MKKRNNFLFSLFLAIFLIPACDFGKAPDPKLVEQLFSGEADVSEDAAQSEYDQYSTMMKNAHGSECDDDCIAGLYYFLISLYGDNWKEKCNDQCVESEYKNYLTLLSEEPLTEDTQKDIPAEEMEAEAIPPDIDSAPPIPQPIPHPAPVIAPQPETSRQSTIRR